MGLRNADKWKDELRVAVGPIMGLLSDDTVTEIEVNAWDWVAAKGSGWKGHKRIEGVRWTSAKSLETALTVMAEVSGRVVSDRKPLYDGRLPGGERVNIAMRPTCDRAAITIRKFPAEVLSLEKLLGYGSISEEVRQMLRGLVLAKKNIIVAGGTNSGKTSLLNAMSRIIPEHERIVTVEDNRELQIVQDNWVALETVQPWAADVDEVTLAQLVKNTLRMTPDRIIVGEVRGEEALYLLRAFSTGHSGGFGTVHSNSAEDALDQLQLLAQFAPVGGTTAAAIAGLVGRAIDIVIHVHQFEEDDSRKVDQIIELERPGVQISESGRIQYRYRNLMRYEVASVEEVGGKPSIVGGWTFPQAPSQALRNTLRFKKLDWPEESLLADEPLEVVA